jgi:hypothetical protein
MVAAARAADMNGKIVILRKRYCTVAKSKQRKMQVL